MADLESEDIEMLKGRRCFCGPDIGLFRTSVYYVVHNDRKKENTPINLGTKNNQSSCAKSHVCVCVPPCVELGSLTTANLMEKVKGLQNLAYQLGVEECEYMTD